jgi:hypothetical protein
MGKMMFSIGTGALIALAAICMTAFGQAGGNNCTNNSCTLGNAPSGCTGTWCYSCTCTTDASNPGVAYCKASYNSWRPGCQSPED